MERAAQLSLFGSRRQRGRKAKPPLEFETQCVLADTLRRWCDPAVWRWTHLPFGEARTDVTGARLARMGTNAGWPDFIFVGPGRIVFLELKRRGNKPTESQVAVAQHIAACGFAYECCDSYKAAVAFLQMQSILPKTIRVQ